MRNLQKKNTQGLSEGEKNMDSTASVQGPATLLYGKQRCLCSFCPSVHLTEIPAKTHVKGGKKGGLGVQLNELTVTFFFLT